MPSVTRRSTMFGSRLGRAIPTLVSSVIQATSTYKAHYFRSTDSDSDGIMDWFEYRMLGISPAVPGTIPTGTDLPTNERITLRISVKDRFATGTSPVPPPPSFMPTPPWSRPHQKRPGRVRNPEETSPSTPTPPPPPERDQRVPLRLLVGQRSPPGGSNGTASTRST